jgi:hypothetical protein
MKRVYDELIREPFPDTVAFSVSARRCFCAVVPNQRDSQFVITSGFHPYRYISNDILGIIHLPGLRGNPATVYQSRPLSSIPFFPGTFSEYTASLIEAWERKSANEYEKLIEFLDILQLVKGVFVRRLDK